MSRLSAIWTALRGSTASQWAERIWWFDLIYPISVAAILFASLTGLVYSGKPSSRLANLAERKLLEHAMLLAPPVEAQHASEILIVNGTPMELGTLKPAPLGRRPELSAAEYARAIDRLATAGAKTIIVSWDIAAHPDDEVYYLPILEVARRHASQTSLVFAVPPDRMQSFPKELTAHSAVVADDPCAERKVRIVLCPYDPDASDWIINRLLELALDGKTAGRPSEEWLTRQMPINLDAFAINVPPSDKLFQMTFGQLLRDSAPLAQVPRIVFMGSSAAGASSGTTDSRFVKTIFDDSAVEIDAGGTPYHVFWAQVASMLIDGAMLRFPPEWVRIPLTVAICATVLIAVIALGGSAALALLGGYAFIVLALNSQVAIPQGWFLPSFDSLYFGGATLIFTATGRVSYLSFRRWQAQEIQRLHVKTADLKANFVSLVSHNLTTPVAGIQGMIAIIIGQTKEPSILERLQAAQMLATRIELTIRFVLATTALEDLRINEQSRSLDAVVKEFLASSSGTLRRLGIVISPPPREGDEEAWMIPVPIDTKLVITALTALVTLHAPHSPRSASVALSFVADLDDDAGATLRVVATGGLQGDNLGFLRLLARSLLEQVARFGMGRFVEIGTNDGLTQKTELRLLFGAKPGPRLA